MPDRCKRSCAKKMNQLKQNNGVDTNNKVAQGMVAR